jgi:ADP-ribosylglycohydrolase
MPHVGLRHRFRAALIGGAIGDAMGRVNEGVWPSEARERRIRDYQPWHGWRSGPKGTSTDDTQMSMWLTESILASVRPGGGWKAAVMVQRHAHLSPDHMLAAAERLARRESSTPGNTRGLGEIRETA